MKRFLCAVVLTAFLFVLAACGGAAKNEAGPTASPTSSSRNTSQVKVNETVANAQNVETGTAQQSATPSTTPAPVDTPATGDYPVMYLAGILGLILICSAGLLMLRRI